MRSYVVVETDNGLTVTEVADRSTPEAEAERCGGVLVDTTPYATFEDAYDALLIIDAESRAELPESVDE
jgi:hypothetical protein